MSLYALRTWGRFKPPDVAALLWALAVLKAPSAECWRAILEKLAMAPVAAFTNAELIDVYSAYILLDQQSAQDLHQLTGITLPERAFTHRCVHCQLTQ